MPKEQHKVPSTSTQVDKVRQTLDPRCALALVFSASIFIWSVPPFLVLLTLLFLLFLGVYAKLFAMLSRESVFRLAKFSCIWGLFVGLLYIFEQRQHAVALSSSLFFSALKASLIFSSRLYSQSLLALFLGSSYSLFTLAQSISWYLSFLSKEHSWKISLAIALLIQYLTRLQYRLDQAKRAVSIRGLSRFYYFSHSLSLIFRLVWKESEDKAIALLSRQLHNPSVWQMQQSLPVQEATISSFCCLLLIVLSCYL